MQFGAGLFQYTEESYPKKFEGLDNALPGSMVIGLPQWRVPEWRSLFYKASTPVSQMLKEYGERLDCVEVSSSFYSSVPSETYKKWKGQVPAYFCFLPKWPQAITHERMLIGCEELASQFIESVQFLQNNLGVTLLQLPPQFSVQHKVQLFHFLKLCPESLPLAIEFRHHSWFKEGRLYEKLESYLRERKIGTICSDTAKRRDVFHTSFTGTVNVIRYLSDGCRETDSQRLAWWSKNIAESGSGRVFYFIIHQPDNTFTPEIIELMDEERAKAIQFLNAEPQASLF